MAGYTREVAKRIYAGELRSSDLSFREGDDLQYAPQYLLTPTGAKCNRVFFVGTLTERDNIGSETEYWRGRVVDPTGSILIYAGQYQPEAAHNLARLEPPAYVAVVGKPSLFETEDGRMILSIRAEAVQGVDEATCDRWILEAAKRTAERLSAMRLSLAAGAPTAQFVTADQAGKSLQMSESDDIQRAFQHYNTDLDLYRQMVLQALSSLKMDREPSVLVTAEEIAPISAKSGIKEAAFSSPPNDVWEGNDEVISFKEPKVDHAQSRPDKKGATRQKGSESRASRDMQSDLDIVETIPLGKRG